jgi:hypothetical protein
LDVGPLSPKIQILAAILVLMKRNGWEMAHTFPVTTDFSSKNAVSTFAKLQTGYSDAGCEWATQSPAEGAEISLITSLLDCSS